MRFVIVLLVVVYVLVMTTMAHSQKIPFSFISGTIIPSAIPTMTGDVTGPIQSNVVGQIQAYPVSTTTPVNGQMMGVVGGKWAPVATASPAPTPMPTPIPGELNLTKSIVASLPTCDSGEDGAYRTVTDALLATCTAGTIVTTGGSVYCLVICQNGVGWVNP